MCKFTIEIDEQLKSQVLSPTNTNPAKCAKPFTYPKTLIQSSLTQITLPNLTHLGLPRPKLLSIPHLSQAPHVAHYLLFGCLSFHFFLQLLTRKQCATDLGHYGRRLTDCHQQQSSRDDMVATICMEYVFLLLFFFFSFSCSFSSSSPSHSSSSYCCRCHS